MNSQKNQAEFRPKTWSFFTTPTHDLCGIVLDSDTWLGTQKQGAIVAGNGFRVASHGARVLIGATPNDAKQGDQIYAKPSEDMTKGWSTKPGEGLINAGAILSIHAASYASADGLVKCTIAVELGGELFPEPGEATEKQTAIWLEKLHDTEREISSFDRMWSHVECPGPLAYDTADDFHDAVYKGRRKREDARTLLVAQRETLRRLYGLPPQTERQPNAPEWLAWSPQAAKDHWHNAQHSAVMNKKAATAKQTAADLVQAQSSIAATLRQAPATTTSQDADEMIAEFDKRWTEAKGPEEKDFAGPSDYAQAKEGWAARHDAARAALVKMRDGLRHREARVQTETVRDGAGFRQIRVGGPTVPVYVDESVEAWHEYRVTYRRLDGSVGKAGCSVADSPNDELAWKAARAEVGYGCEILSIERTATHLPREETPVLVDGDAQHNAFTLDAACDAYLGDTQDAKPYALRNEHTVGAIVLADRSNPAQQEREWSLGAGLTAAILRENAVAAKTAPAKLTANLLLRVAELAYAHVSKPDVRDTSMLLPALQRAATDIKCSDVRKLIERAQTDSKVRQCVEQICKLTQEVQYDDVPRMFARLLAGELPAGHIVAGLESAHVSEAFIDELLGLLDETESTQETSVKLTPQPEVTPPRTVPANARLLHAVAELAFGSVQLRDVRNADTLIPALLRVAVDVDGLELRAFIQQAQTHKETREWIEHACSLVFQTRGDLAQFQSHLARQMAAGLPEGWVEHVTPAYGRDWYSVVDLNGDFGKEFTNPIDALLDALDRVREYGRERGETRPLSPEDAAIVAGSRVRRRLPGHPHLDPIALKAGIELGDTAELSQGYGTKRVWKGETKATVLEIRDIVVDWTEYPELSWGATLSRRCLVRLDDGTEGWTSAGSCVLETLDSGAATMNAPEASPDESRTWWHKGEGLVTSEDLLSIVAHMWRLVPFEHRAKVDTIDVIRALVAAPNGLRTQGLAQRAMQRDADGYALSRLIESHPADCAVEPRPISADALGIVREWLDALPRGDGSPMWLDEGYWPIPVTLLRELLASHEWYVSRAPASSSIDAHNRGMMAVADALGWAGDGDPLAYANDVRDEWREEIETLTRELAGVQRDRDTAYARGRSDALVERTEWFAAREATLNANVAGMRDSAAKILERWLAAPTSSLSGCWGPLRRLTCRWLIDNGLAPEGDDLDPSQSSSKRVYLDIPGEFLTEAAPQPELPAVGDVVTHEGRHLFVVQRRFENERVVLRVREANERNDLASTWGPLATAHERKLIWAIHQALCFKVGPALDEVIAQSVDAFAPTSAPDTLRTTETRVVSVDDAQDEPPAEDAPRERLRGEHFDIHFDDPLVADANPPEVRRQRFWQWLTSDATACFAEIQIARATRFASQAASLGYPPPQAEKAHDGTMWLTWDMTSTKGRFMLDVRPDGTCRWSVVRHDDGPKIVLPEGPGDTTDPLRGSEAEFDVRARYRNAKTNGDAAQVEALRWGFDS